MDRRFDERIRRHPLCPKCRYDLVATIDANKRICPECGHEFTLSELIRAPREGDWTPAQGMVRLGGALGLRTLAILPIWTVVFGVVLAGISLIPDGATRTVAVTTLLIFVFIPGIVVGKILGKDLASIAGMTSVLVAAAGVVAALAIGFGGPLIVGLILSVSPSLILYTGFTVGCVAAIFVVKDTLFET